MNQNFLNAHGSEKNRSLDSATYSINPRLIRASKVDYFMETISVGFDNGMPARYSLDKTKIEITLGCSTRRRKL